MDARPGLKSSRSSVEPGVFFVCKVNDQRGDDRQSESDRERSGVRGEEVRDRRRDAIERSRDRSTLSPLITENGGKPVRDQISAGGGKQDCGEGVHERRRAPHDAGDDALGERNRDGKREQGAGGAGGEGGEVTATREGIRDTARRQALTTKPGPAVTNPRISA